MRKGGEAVKITLESTTKVCTLNGIQVRVWEGKTEAGVPMCAFIARVAVSRDEDVAQFDRDLQACRVPSAEVSAFPARMIL